MELTAEQILENWNNIINIINKEFSGDRKQKLLKLYEDYKDRIMYAPASSREYFHNCFPGGYLIHILNVIKFADQLDMMWEKNLGENGIVKTYTREELIFVALNHDFGKLGDEDGEHYITHDEHWKKERGELYNSNENINNMDLIDRTFYMLQLYGITVSKNEFLGIKLHEMMFDKANEFYLMVYTKGKQLKTELPVIIHSADFMSTKFEYLNWLNSIPSTQKNVKNISKKQIQKKSKNLSSHAAEIAMKFFNEKEK